MLMKITPTCVELRVSYDRWVTAMKLSPETLRMLSSQVLELLFKYSGHGTYCQATPRQLSLCVTGCDELPSNRQWVVSRSSTIVLSIYLALKTSLVQQKILISFGSPQRDRWRSFSEVSIAVTNNHVNINSVWKLLETSCVCVWLKFERAFSMSLSPALMFTSCTKWAHLQFLQC